MTAELSVTVDSKWRAPAQCAPGRFNRLVLFAWILSVVFFTGSRPAEAQNKNPRDVIFEAAHAEQEILDKKIASIDDILSGINPCEFNKTNAVFEEFTALFVSVRSKWDEYDKNYLLGLENDVRNTGRTKEVAEELEREANQMITDANRVVEDERSRLSGQIGPIAKQQLQILIDKKMEEIAKAKSSLEEFTKALSANSDMLNALSIMKRTATSVQNIRKLTLGSYRLLLAQKQEFFSRQCSSAREIQKP